MKPAISKQVAGFLFSENTLSYNEPYNKPVNLAGSLFRLALFAGIRPAINGGELVRIGQLKDNIRIIDLNTEVIRITPDIAKTKDVRQITSPT